MLSLIHSSSIEKKLTSPKEIPKIIYYDKEPSFQKQPPEVFFKKGVLRIFTKFIGKHLCQRLFFNKVAGPRPATLLKKSLWHRCFPINFAKFLRTPFLQNTSGRLLLSFRESFKRVSSVSVHERSAQMLATEIYKVKNNNSPIHMNKTFEIRNEHPYNLWQNSQFSRPLVKSVFPFRLKSLEKSTKHLQKHR